MYDEHIMQLALNVSKLSKDPSTQVGCVITNSAKEILSVGFNKLKDYVPIKDIGYVYDNKHIKRYASTHAEIMALSRLKETNEELSVYITHPSCIICTVELVLNSNFNIKNIFYIDRGSDEFKLRYNIKEALELMSHKNINVLPLNEDLKVS